MNKVQRKIGIGVLALATLFSLTACFENDADVASENISTEADNFKILRRIVAINAITDQYLLTIEGWCNINYDRDDKQLEVTCKHDDGYTKDFVGISDNVTYTVQQLVSAKVSTDHYKVVFKPTTVLPDVEVH